MEADNSLNDGRRKEISLGRRTAVGKVFLFMMVSLDGYHEGPDHDISWHNVDEEFNDFAIEQTSAADLLVFGRRTYELMADFWPSEQALREAPKIAKLMNETPKLVFSHTLKNADWNNTDLAVNVEQEFPKIKEQPSKDIAVFGSNNLSVSLLELGLLDELRIMVNPVVLGAGTPLLEGLSGPIKLSLTDTRLFKNGNVLLTYQPGSGQ
jgi:dihydrofolate reductase